MNLVYDFAKERWVAKTATTDAEAADEGYIIALSDFEQDPIGVICDLVEQDWFDAQDFVDFIYEYRNDKG